jgi:hypothetical protein
MGTARFVVAVLLAWGCAWFGVRHTLRCYRRGYTWTGRWGYEQRASDPFGFWLTLGTFAVCTLIFAGVAIVFTWFLPQAFSEACRHASSPAGCGL